MDTALEILDPLIFDKVYAYFVPAKSAAHNGTAYEDALAWTSGPSASTPPAAAVSAWPRDNIIRQCISILIITQIGAMALYWIFSALSYYFIFDRRLEYHPRFLKNQIRQEIASSMHAIPFINIMTLPFFLAEVRGHSLLYTRVDEYGWPWLIISTVLFMIWNDFMIYWIHRLEHHPSVYKYIHKPHHKWIGNFPLPRSPIHSPVGHFRRTACADLPAFLNSADPMGGPRLPPAGRLCSVFALPVSHLSGPFFSLLHPPPQK